MSKPGEFHGRPAVWKVFVLAGIVQEGQADQVTTSGTSERCVTTGKGRRLRTWRHAVCLSR
jgi:hypothetical protein